MSKQYYDESQIKRHPKRNRAQNKAIKNMIYHLDLMLGENHAGEVLAMLCDCLDRAVKNTPAQRLQIRTFEIRLNDIFSVKFDAEKGAYVE